MFNYTTIPYRPYTLWLVSHFNLSKISLAIILTILNPVESKPTYR
jgi:hypothetical protein